MKTSVLRNKLSTIIGESENTFMQDVTVLNLIGNKAAGRMYKIAFKNERLIETVVRFCEPSLGYCTSDSCTNRTKLLSWKTRKFATYCSNKCSKSDPKRLLKVKSTCMARYGVSNVSKVVSFKNKKKETCMLNFGVSHPQQSKKVRAKSEETNLRKYGVRNVSNAVDVQRKREATFMERFGVDNPRKSEQVKSSMREAWVSKYGVDHPMKTLEVLKLVMARRAHNPYTTKRNKKITIQGKTFNCFGYEPTAIKWLVSIGVHVNDISVKKVPPVSYWCTTKEKIRTYFPDLKIKLNGEIVYVEVKSSATLLGYKDHKTFNAVRDKAVGVMESGRKLLTLVFESDKSKQPVLKTFKLHSKEFDQVAQKLIESGSRYALRDIFSH